MCKKMTANYVEVLGTRRIGWQLWDGQQMQGMTDVQIRNYIRGGGVVNGLKLEDDGTVVPDPEWCHADTEAGVVILEKSGVNTFSPLDPDANLVAAKSFTLVKVERRGKELTYYFLTNRWAVEAMQEDKVRAILTLMPMGGVWLEGKRLAVHPQVEVVDVEQPTAEG